MQQTTVKVTAYTVWWRKECMSDAVTRTTEASSCGKQPLLNQYHQGEALHFGWVCADSKKKDSQEGQLNEFVVQKAIKRDHYQFQL